VSYTEADTRVLLTDVISLGIGEEHVGGKTTLWRVGIYEQVRLARQATTAGFEHDGPFFFLPPSPRVPFLAALALGISDVSEAFELTFDLESVSAAFALTMARLIVATEKERNKM
jgi:hypothetical protein